jgi:putative polyhydroxyalkanoate system protein
MRIAVSHNTTKENARAIVEKRLEDLQRQYGHYTTEVEKNWDGDRLDFSVKARGFHGKGTLEVTETDVIIDGKLPLIAKPFEPRIRSTVEREAEEMFRRA